MDMYTINELMAALGFIVPSAVLWQVWNIRATFNQTKDKVDRIERDLSALRRTVEDEIMKKGMRV